MRTFLATIITKFSWLWAPKAAPAEKDCLARKYAGCHDEKHCPYCSPTEQALRTVSQINDGA